MDNLDPYNVGAPVAPQAVPDYNMMQYIANHANAQVMNVSKPVTAAEIAAVGVPNVSPVEATPKKSAWDTLLESNPDKANDPKGYAELAHQFRLNLEASLYAHKYTKDGVEAALNLFDDKVLRGAPKMTPEQAAAGDGADHGNLLGENLTGVAGMAAKVVPGLMSAADLAYRNIRGLADTTVSGKDAWGFNTYHTPLGEKTALGQGADQMTAGIDKFIRGTTSQATLAQEDEIAKHIRERVPQGEVAGFIDTIGQYLDPSHWRATAHMATQGAATLIPMGATGSAIRLLGGAEKLKALTDAERILALGGPTGAAYAGGSSSEFEQKVRDTPIDQLLKDRPDLAHIYEAGGRTKDAADSIKQNIIDSGANKVFGINAIANSVLPAIPGLHGAEGVVAGLGAGRTVSMARNALNKGVSEATEEGIAGGVQDTAQNQALGRPVFEGAGSNVAQNALAGAVGGAAAGMVERKAKPLKRPNANASTTSQEATGETTDEPATPVAERGGDRFAGLPAKPMADVKFAKVVEDFHAKLADSEGAFETQLTDRKTDKVKDADGIIRTAENQAHKHTGKEAWAKLDAAQRLALVEEYLRAAAKQVEIPKLDEFIAAYKQKKISELSAPAAVAPTGVQETPLPAGVEGTQVPGTVAPELTPKDKALADLKAFHAANKPILLPDTGEANPEFAQLLQAAHAAEATDAEISTTAQIAPTAHEPAPQTHSIPYDTVSQAGEGQPLVRSSGTAPIIDFGGRKMVTRLINGVRVPFYLSTGNGGKKGVKAGKWYPFFGVSQDGWINKLGEKEINDYYGSPELKAAAEELDTSIGDVRNDTTIPKVSRDGAHTAHINEGFTPTENETPTTRTQIEANIASLKERIAKGKSAPVEHKPAPQTNTERKMVTEEDKKRLEARTVADLATNGDDVTANNARDLVSLLMNDHGLKLEEAGKLTLGQAREIINNGIQPAPTTTPKPQTVGRLKRVPVTEEAKTENTPKTTDSQKARNIYLDHFFKSLIDKPNPSDAENRADPRFNAARTARSNGHIQTPDQLSVFLDAEAKRLANESPVMASLPVVERKPDNRLVSKVINSVGKDNRKARAEVKAMMQVIAEAGTMTPTEMKSSTVEQLREHHAEVVKNGGTPPVEASRKSKPPRKGKKTIGVRVQDGKEIPSSQVTTTPNDSNNMPVGNNRERKVNPSGKNATGSSYGGALVSALMTETFGKLTAGKRAQNHVTQIMNRLQTLREQGVKGVPTESALGKYTYDELIDADDRIVNAQLGEALKEEKSRNIKAKSEKEKADLLAKQEAVAPTDMERAQTTIESLATEDAGKLSDKKIPKNKVEALQELFKANLRTGKFSDLQDALTKAGVFKPAIDKIIAQAKEARKAELSRFEGFNDAEGKPLTKSAKDKIAALYFDFTEGKLSLTKFRKGVQAITFDETGNGPEKILEATAAREKSSAQESTPPKTPAPLTKGADAGKKSRKTPAATTAPSIPVHVQIAERFADLGARARKELVSAVKLAQEGDGTALAEFIKDHLESEEITKEDAVALRKMGAENPIDYKLRNLEQAKQIVAEADDEAHQEDVLEPTTVEDIARSLLAQEDVQSDREWMMAVQEEEKETAKGIDAVRAWLQSLRKVASQRAGADFALWVLDQNPNIASGLSVRLQAGMRSFGEGGSYSFGKVLIKLDKAGADVRTMVHEIMHHAERMMPKALQAKIREEYNARFDNKVIQQQRIVDDENSMPAEKLQAQYNLAFLKLVKLSRNESGKLDPNGLNKDKIEAHFKESDRIQREAEEARQAALGLITGGQVKTAEMYKYMNPSEYWAEEASALLQRRADNTGWKAQLKEWYTEFTQHINALLGKDNQSALYTAMRSIMNSSGKDKSDGFIKNGKDEAASVTGPVTAPANEQEDQPAIVTPETVALKDLAKNENISGIQRFWEAAAKSTQAILEGEYELFNKGVTDLHFTDLVSTAISAYRGITSNINRDDMHDVVRPFREYLAENFRNFTNDDNFDSALANLNSYFGAKHLLERIRFNWAFNVELKGGRSADRDDIIQEWKDGELGSKQAKLQLMSLAQKYGIHDMQTHAEQQGMSRATFEAIGTTLEALKNDHGMSDDAMADLNKLRKDVSDRQRQRVIESGQTSKKDKWIDLYDYQYYVPLKGNGKNVDPALNDFNSPNDTRVALAQLNQGIKLANSRVTFAEDPLNRLFVDTMRSGERAAFKGVAKALYLLAVDHGKEMGAHITRWNGTPKDGYTNGTLDNKGRLKVFQNIQGTANAIIYHNGDQHYVVRLPAESQFLRGMAGMNAVKPLPVPLKILSKGTNTLGRLYTTFSPFWSFALGFLRDWTTIPASIATENFDNPLQASSFLGAYTAEMLQLYKAFPTLSATILDDVGALKDMAKEDPESYAGYLGRYLAAGGANNFTEGFELSNADQLFKGSYDTTTGMWDATKLTYNKVADLTGNWANFLEQMTRVAAFKALLKADPNMSDTEAAVKVRRVLDYSESGTYGRIVNSFTAFFRTSMTSTDTMVRSFRDKGGKFNAKKFGIWAGTYAGIGLVTFLASAALMGDDDDEDKDGNPIKVPKINKIKLRTLVQKFALPIGDKVYGIPIGLGMPQVMLSPGIVLGAIASGHSTWEEGVGALWQVFNNNGPNRVAGMRGTYTDPTNVLGTVLQSLPVVNMTVTQPVLDVYNNLDSFGQPIHREHYDKDKPKYGQANPGTPTQWVDMAQTLYKNSNGAVDMFPEELRFYANNYGGQNVSDLLKAVVDLDNKNLMGEDAYFNPATSRFEIKDLDYYNSNEMYETMDAIGGKNRKYKEIAADAQLAGKSTEEATAMADSARSKDPATSAAVKQANKIKQMIKDRAKKLAGMRADRTMSDARRQAVRKQLDSDLRKETLKAQYLLEKIP